MDRSRAPLTVASTRGGHDARHRGRHPKGRHYFLVDDRRGAISFHGRIEYLDIERPQRIVYTQWFTNERGNISRHPLSPIWPERMRATVELTSESPHSTLVIMKWDIDGAVRPLPVGALQPGEGAVGLSECDIYAPDAERFARLQLRAAEALARRLASAPPLAGAGGAELLGDVGRSLAPCPNQ